MVRTRVFQFLILFTLLISSSSCQTSKIILADNINQETSSYEATGVNYGISTQGKYSSLAADEMFKKGGNIIDAVVAASFTVSVERPQSTGIGGGGFMIFRKKDGSTYAIDFRERAPLKATPDMYIQNGKGNTRLSQNGILASATPGLVAGLIEVHKKFGSLPLKTVMQSAIDLAENGFPIYSTLHRALTYRAKVLNQDPEARKIFLDREGKPLPLGHLLVQKDLAQTLRKISEKGSDEFYKGETSKKIVKFFSQAKGVLSQKDLAQYKVKWRTPITGKYKNYEVISMPPPSSGGIHILQFLNFLENDDLKSKGVLSTESIHLAASALQHAFADRAAHIGDPDFVEVPVQKLVAPEYVQSRRSNVILDKAKTAVEVKAGEFPTQESTETTHLSIMDKDGNAVSTTQTINGWFGSGVVVPGTGILMNNEMDDFSIQDGVPNLFGAVGVKSKDKTLNAIAPLKTPLSSMSPTLLVQNGETVLSLGAPGGTRIISCVAQTILNYTEFNLSLKDAISIIRYHHQWQPDVLFIDPPGPKRKVLRDLQKMGYKVEVKPNNCSVMAVSKENNIFRAVSDPRDIGVGLAH